MLATTGGRLGSRKVVGMTCNVRAAFGVLLRGIDQFLSPARCHAISTVCRERNT